MNQLLNIHPENPQGRLLQIAVDKLRTGGVVAYPTDTSYALACHIGDKRALDRIIGIRRLDKRHHFTLACADLSMLGVFARVDNAQYRLLKRVTPGPYTFILRASREVPKRLIHERHRTIGIRVPDHRIAQALLRLMGEPLMTTTLQLPDDAAALIAGDEIAARIGKQVDVVLDGGYCDPQGSTVVDLSGDTPQVLRQGKASADFF